MTMCSLTRHISNPNRHDDEVDHLDIVCCPEIASLVREVVLPGNGKSSRDAFKALQALGMFVDVIRGRADATHTLTTPRAVYVLRLV